MKTSNLKEKQLHVCTNWDLRTKDAKVTFFKDLNATVKYSNTCY